MYIPRCESSNRLSRMTEWNRGKVRGNGGGHPAYARFNQLILSPCPSLPPPLTAATFTHWTQKQHRWTFPLPDSPSTIKSSWSSLRRQGRVGVLKERRQLLGRLVTFYDKLSSFYTVNGKYHISTNLLVQIEQHHLSSWQSVWKSYYITIKLFSYCITMNFRTNFCFRKLFDNDICTYIYSNYPK